LSPSIQALETLRIVAVIPAYNVAGTIERVIAEMPPLVTHILVVDDASTDDTVDVVLRSAARDSRIEFLRHTTNGGVGAAMISGFRRALELDPAIVVKIDGDGQMPLSYLPRLIAPLLDGRADYVKGNRFRDSKEIRQMPPLRRFGNLILSFLAKAATGYWSSFDPANGYTAIRGEVLAMLPLEAIDHGWFFEISMLTRLYLLGAVVHDEPIPARYEGAPSSLSVAHVARDFPARLLYAFARRVVLRYFVYDVSMASVELAAGLPLFLAGLLFGGYKWYWYASRDIAAPAGTVVLAAVLIILGAQLLLSVIALDLAAVPSAPINDGPLRVASVEAGILAARNGAAASRNRSHEQPKRDS
jgi:dolichol-phosphate mannosyltransferase